MAIISISKTNVTLERERERGKRMNFRRLLKLYQGVLEGKKICHIS